MKKISLLLVISFLVLASVVHAEYKVNIKPDSIIPGVTIYGLISGDSYYRHIYVYDEKENYKGRITLNCNEFRCKGENSFTFSIPFSFKPGKAYLRIYDYSKKADAPGLVGWTNFYFNVDSSDKKLNLACVKQVWLNPHEGKCDPNNCYNENMNYTQCYTYPSSLVYNLMRLAGKSKELCENTYSTGCSYEPECRIGYQEKSVKVCEKCKDSDGGKEYYAKGTTVGLQRDEVVTKIDYCINKETLAEWYCYPLDDHVESLSYICRYGCEDGACVKSTFVIADIQGYKEVYSSDEKISLTIKGIELADHSPTSQEEGFNVQVYVNTGKPGEENEFGANARYYNGYWYIDSAGPFKAGKHKLGIYLYCANDDGICAQRYGKATQVEKEMWFEVKEQNCTDSDGGKDYYTSGKAQLTNGGAAYDICGKDAKIAGHSQTENALQEYYCRNNVITVDFFECPNGCKDGACIKKNTSVCNILSKELDCSNFKVYPDYATFDLKNNLGRDTVIPGVDLISGGCSIWKETSLRNEETKTMKLENCSNGPSGVLFESKIIIAYDDLKYSRGVKGSVRAIVEGQSAVCGNGVCESEEREPIQLINYILTSFMVKEYSECKEMSAINLLRDCAKYDQTLCSGKSTCEFLREQIPIMLSKTLKDAQYQFLVTSKDKTLLKVGDKCLGDSLNKHYLIPIDSRGQEILVVELAICEPTCLKDCQTQKCTDSDGGKNYYIKGNATGIYGSCVESCVKQSSGEMWVHECYCDGSNPWTASMTIACPTGTTCKDGACLEVSGRFLDKGDFVLDTWSDLNWQKDGSASGKMNFNEALKYCGDLTLGGFSDWRVPIGVELQSIYPALESPFVNTKHGFGESYWTSELDNRLDDYAYLVHWYLNAPLSIPGKNNVYGSKNFVNIRCVRGESNIYCKDFDGGNLYDKKGKTCLVSSFGGEGKCLISTGDKCEGCTETGCSSILESYCVKNEIQYMQYGCPNGCKDGACIKENATKCTDSDSGKDYYTKGIVKGIERRSDGSLVIMEDGSYDYGEFEDKCNGNLLGEFYCKADGGVYGEEYKCPNGCKDGACIQKNATKCIDSDGGDNKWQKGYLTVDGKIYGEEFCYTKEQGELYGSVGESFCINNGQGTSTSNPRKCENGCKDGACVKENATKCTDTDGGENIYETGDAQGSDGKGTFDNCDFLKDYTYGVLNEAICKDGVASFVSVTCPKKTPYCNRAVCSSTPPKCTDTDNGDNQYVKGTMTEPRLNEGPKHTDYCENLKTLQPWDDCKGELCGIREYYCESPYITTTYKDIKCPNGCKNGACVKVDCNSIKNQTACLSFENCYYDEKTSRCYGTRLSCEDEIDSENDLYKKGRLWAYGYHLISPRLRIAAYDYCKGDYLYQVYCDKEDFAVYKIQVECPNGCKDGACIQYKCEETDGGNNIYVKGLMNTNWPSWDPNTPEKCAVQVGPGNHEHRESCSGDNCWVVEYYCKQSLPQANVMKCPNGCKDGACIQSCGNGLIDSEVEECDSGKLNGNDFCSSNCKLIGNKIAPVKCQIVYNKTFDKDRICDVAFGYLKGNCIIKKGQSSCVSNLILPMNGNEVHYKPYLSGKLTDAKIFSTAYNGINYFVNFQKNEQCTDSDGGQNINKAGYAQGSDGRGTFDNCDFSNNTRGILKEAVCEKGFAAFVDVKCPSRTPYCNRAICSSTSPRCTDSDKGANQYVRGTMIEPRLKEGPVYTDYCENLKTLQPWNNCKGELCGIREYYCESPYRETTYKDIKCPKGCKNGVCVR